MNIKIEALIARKIGFASHQNAVPLVRELSIWNQEETTLENLTQSSTRYWFNVSHVHMASNDRVD